MTERKKKKRDIEIISLQTLITAQDHLIFTQKKHNNFIIINLKMNYKKGTKNDSEIWRTHKRRSQKNFVKTKTINKLYIQHRILILIMIALIFNDSNFKRSK